MVVDYPKLTFHILVFWVFLNLFKFILLCIYLGGCRPDEWTCDNGDCIDEDRVCDFREDCRDGSDEEQNCKQMTDHLFLLTNNYNRLELRKGGIFV